MIASWVIIAFISGLLSNTSNYLHRYLLKDDQDPALYTWFLELVRFLSGGFFLLFNFYLVVSTKTIFLLILFGVVEAVSIYIYMKQHAYAQLSISTIISRTRLIWTAIFAFLLLGEHLGLQTYVGIAVLFLGLSISTAPNKIMADKGMKYAYSSAVLISVTNILAKAISPFASTPLMVFSMSLETVFGYPLILKNSKERIIKFLQTNLFKKTLAAGANVTALFLQLTAIRMGPITLVNAIYQGTMVFAILAGIIFLNEREDIFKKLIGTGIALVGVFLLS